MLFFYTGITAIWVNVISNFKLFSIWVFITTIIQFIVFLNLYNGIVEKKYKSELQTSGPVGEKAIGQWRK